MNQNQVSFSYNLVEPCSLLYHEFYDLFNIHRLFFMLGTVNRFRMACFLPIVAQSGFAFAALLLCMTYIAL